MKKISFNAEHKRVLDAMLLKIADVQPGKMFGYPGYYVNGKLFACVMEEILRNSIAFVGSARAPKQKVSQPKRTR